MADDLYRDYILEHYKRPRNFGELEPHDLEAHDHNPLCGDEMGVHIRVEDGKIADLKWHGQGCAISQAAASIASDELIEVERWLDRTDGETIRLGYAIDVIGGNHGSHAAHVLHDDIRITWNIFRDELGNEAGVEIIYASCRSTRHKPDGFALVEGGLGLEVSSTEHKSKAKTLGSIDVLSLAQRPE